MHVCIYVYHLYRPKNAQYSKVQPSILKYTLAWKWVMSWGMAKTIGISRTTSLSPHVWTCYGGSSTTALSHESPVKGHENIISNIFFRKPLFPEKRIMAWHAYGGGRLDPFLKIFNQCNRLAGMGDLTPYWIFNQCNRLTVAGGLTPTWWPLISVIVYRGWRGWFAIEGLEHSICVKVESGRTALPEPII